ncbi:F-box only protein 48 [Galemys pyrenaicus]|uniref:F-box only protein 48 n=1 Tax=Galemys pyrenaicus TaxID=202257 RepID=A0A8J6DJ62_GALPY|nr:F-box only protein 48 [Galemys pyrenaicus]
MNSLDVENDNRENQSNYFELLPVEITCYIFCLLDIPGLCRASETCQDWNDLIMNTDFIWKGPCLTLQSVCPKEVKNDVEKGYSLKETVQRNYRKSQVKHKWLSGHFSNLHSSVSLPEEIMCQMDADTWALILEAELTR